MLMPLILSSTLVPPPLDWQAGRFFTFPITKVNKIEIHLNPANDCQTQSLTRESLDETISLFIIHKYLRKSMQAILVLDARVATYLILQHRLHVYFEFITSRLRLTLNYRSLVAHEILIHECVHFAGQLPSYSFFLLEPIRAPCLLIITNATNQYNTSIYFFFKLYRIAEAQTCQQWPELTRITHARTTAFNITTCYNYD